MRTWSGVTRRAIVRGYARELKIEAPPGDPVLASVDDLWREQRLDARWMVACRLTVQRGSLVVGEVRVFPVEAAEGRPAGEGSARGLGSHARCPRGGITRSLLRRVSPGEALRMAARQLEQWGVKEERAFWGAALERAEQVSPVLKLAEPRTAAVRKRRPRISDQELQRFAQAYRRAYSREPHSPNVILAAKWKKPAWWVRDRVRLCRQRGLLPESHGRGRASI